MATKKANQINDAILAELQALKAKIAVLEQENKELKAKKSNEITEDIIKNAIKKAEDALKIKIVKYLTENNTVAFITDQGYISIATLNAIQKRLYIKSKMTKEDVILLNEIIK
jgi:ribosomal protein L31E